MSKIICAFKGLGFCGLCGLCGFGVFRYGKVGWIGEDFLDWNWKVESGVDCGGWEVKSCGALDGYEGRGVRLSSY